MQEISQTDYSSPHAFKILANLVLVVWLSFATSARAQDNPLEDPDLQQLLKQAQEMQKNARDLQKSPGSPDTRKKLADMEAMAKEQAAQQEQEEKEEGKITGRAQETARGPRSCRVPRLDAGHT